jgi:hypothetical protein
MKILFPLISVHILRFDMIHFETFMYYDHVGKHVVSLAEIAINIVIWIPAD